MKTRIITGAILAAIAVTILSLQNEYLLCGTLSLVAAFMTYELVDALGYRKNYLFLILSIAFSLALPMLVISSFSKILLLVIPLYFALSLFVVLLDYDRIDMKLIGLFYTEYILMLIGMGALACIRLYFAIDGLYYIIMTLFFAFATDTGAYFTGSAIGKHKLCPNISPKKTVEGSIGGLVFSLIICTLATVAYDLWLTPDSVSINYIAQIILTLAASLCSMIGDLVASTVKRACGIKDFGKLLPGHGGMLDRMDSFIFVTPITFGFISLFPIVIR